MKLATLIAAALASVPAPGSFALDTVRADSSTIPLETTPAASAILGNWWSEGKDGLMKIEQTKTGLFQVRVLDGKDADKKDVNNPDPKLRDRVLRGIVIMWNLRFDDGEYVDGYCYNPRDGKTYRVKFKLLSANELKLRGYLAVPLLGQSQIWTRAG